MTEKQNTFSIAGVRFEHPDGWSDFYLHFDCVNRGSTLHAKNSLGESKTVEIPPLTGRERDVLDEGVLRGSMCEKIKTALAQFTPIDALDVLRAAQ